MDVGRVRALCLAMPGPTEEVLGGSELVFKVGGKMFCVVPLEPGPVWLSFKTEEETFAELIERPGIVPAPYLARAHWVALEAEDAMPLRELVTARLPAKVRAGLISKRKTARG